MRSNIYFGRPLNARAPRPGAPGSSTGSSRVGTAPQNLENRLTSPLYQLGHDPPSQSPWGAPRAVFGGLGGWKSFPGGIKAPAGTAIDAVDQPRPAFGQSQNFF